MPPLVPCRLRVGLLGTKSAAPRTHVAAGTCTTWLPSVAKDANGLSCTHRHKHLSWLQANQLVSRHTSIRAADPVDK